MSINYGNPSLNAEVSHSFELGYTYFTPKFNFSASSSASFVNNSIESISKVQSNGATVTTYENIGKNQRFGISLYISYRPNAKLNIYYNGSGSYSKLESNNGYAISNEGFSYDGSLGGRWTLWKDGSINLNSGIYSPSIMLQGKSPAFFYTSIGVSQYFLKRKLMLSVSASDPLWYKKKYIFESHDITFFTHNEYIQLAQSVRFSITYNFGKMDLQVKKARRGIQNDDLKNGGAKQGGETN
jgi:outer membrane receptor protein involved in Fe transport